MSRKDLFQMISADSVKKFVKRAKKFEDYRETNEIAYELEKISNLIFIRALMGETSLELERSGEDDYFEAELGEESCSIFHKGRKEQTINFLKERGYFVRNYCDKYDYEYIEISWEEKE